jgi:hypothetical protein
MKHFLLTFFALVAYIGFSQTKNQQRLNELPKLIELADHENNFQKKDSLLKEQSLRLNIEQAIENENYSIADSLKNELDNKFAEKQPQLPKNSQSIQSSYDDSMDVNQNEWLKNHKVYKSGFYVDLNLTQLALMKEFNYSGLDVGYTVGVDFGNKFFKRKQYNNVRLGLDMQWFNFSCSWFIYQQDINLSICRPGIALGYAIDSKNGLDFNFNAGINMKLHNGSPYIGFALSPQIRYRYKFFSAGIINHTSLGYNSDFVLLNNLGLSVGFKF